jgi:hypothetical protein
VQINNIINYLIFNKKLNKLFIYLNRMIQIEFDYNQQITVIQAKLDEPFKVAIDKYLQKVLLDPNNVFFIANGRQINPEDKIENQISQSNKENKKLKILVQLIERTTIIEQFAKSKDIICPECK